MRVLQLSLDYAPFWHRGGPPRIMYSYAQGLIQKNVKIKCICSSHGDKAFSGKTEILDGSEVVYLKELEQSFLKRFYLNFSPFKIWYEIKVFYKPNLIIHLSQTRSIFNIMALIFSYFYKVNIVFSPFGSLPNRGSLVLKIFDFFVTNQLVKRASLNLGQTVHELDVLVGFGATKTSLLLAPLCYEGIVCPSEDTRDRIRNEMGCGVSTRVILFLGRFHKTKGVVDLIESFSLSSRKKSDAQLWLVGVDDGDLINIKETIERLKLESTVKVVLPKYGNERFDWYFSSDLYAISPIIFEETPLAAVEALSVGTPVLTNVKAEVPFLSEYNAGYIAKDVDNFREILDDFLMSTDFELYELREGARKCFRREFNLSKNVENLYTKFARLESDCKI